MKRGLDEVFDWQVFFPGFDPASPVPQVPWCARLRAARVMVHAVHSLKRYGWIAASRFISQIERVEGCPQDWSSINGVGLARRELTLARVLHRFVDPSGA